MKKVYTMEDVPILYEDNCVLVVCKPQNLPSQADVSGDVDLLTLLKGYVKEKYNKPGEAYVGLVHRLDRPTGGLMVFAKNSKSASRLSEQFKTGDLEKTYFATVLGEPNEPQAQIVSYLKKNALTNKVYVATYSDQGVKRAELTYKTLETFHGVASLLQINLGTGRSHQIRVQLSSQGHPIFGDVKYGGDKLAKGHNLALWAVKLSFLHPVTKQRMVFYSYPPATEPWVKFNMEEHLKLFSDSE